MHTLESVTETAMSLSPEDKEVLVARLNASLWRERDPAVAEAWEREIRRRVRELDDNPSAGVTLGEALDASLAATRR